jgi:hypothetical protein
MPEPLFHYTCDHGARLIGRSGPCVLLPFMHPWLGKKLVWLTDLDAPERRAVGLTSTHIRCDRLRHRYVVDDQRHVRAWLDSLERLRLIESMRQAFEFDDDGRPSSPEHWWISDRALVARYDRAWRHAG